MKPLPMPGVYVTDDGSLHIDVTDLLQHLWKDDPFWKKDHP